MTKKHGETTAADRQSPRRKFRAFLCDAKIIENLTFAVSCCILYVYLCDGYVMKKYFCLFENITCMIQVITVFLY